MQAALLAHLWQSTLCAIAGAALVLTLRRYTARTRYLVWLAASLKFLIPFSALIALGRELRPAHPLELELIPKSLLTAALSLGQGIAIPEIQATHATPSFLLLTLATVWAVGAAVFLTRWFITWLSIRSAVHAADLLRCHGDLSIDLPIDVRVSDAFSEPGVFGILEPVLLLPKEAATGMTADELNAVIAHELCHVRHRDNLAAAAHNLIQALFWFHPLVWWIGHRLLEERERACDEVVIELGATPRTYAESILKACRLSVESRLAGSMGVVAGASGACLKHRIEDIIAHRSNCHLSTLGKVGLVTLGAAVVILPFSFGLASPISAAPCQSLCLRYGTRSIVPTAPGSDSASRLTWEEGRLSMRNTSLRKLVAIAYGTSERRVIGGPEWVDQHFDIEASAPSLPGEVDRDPGVQRHRLRTLLTEQFNLRLIVFGRD